MSTRWLLAAGLSVALAAVAAASDDADGRMLPDPNKARVEEPPQLPSVYGKYRVLLRKINVPQDTNAYGQFTDYGMYTGNSWAGFNDLPPGYWVYVYPNWYIWRDCVKPNLVVPPVRNPQQFGGGKATIDPRLDGIVPDQGVRPRKGIGDDEEVKRILEELKKLDKQMELTGPFSPPPGDKEEELKKIVEELKKLERQQKK
jgi:hypothetical protein